MNNQLTKIALAKIQPIFSQVVLYFFWENGSEIRWVDPLSSSKEASTLSSLSFASWSMKLLLLRCSHIFHSQKCKSSLCCSRRRRQASWWEIMKPSNCCGKCQKPSCFHPNAWCRALPLAFHTIWTHCPIQKIYIPQDDNVISNCNG